ncbi:MAG TPA: DNA polymerase III subunit alpha [Bacteroidetes bacterium]|nr:DNA polymerase III subunit alpha [Bacteroidota bacterium]
MFVHLNLHSHYSLLRGTASPEELCQAVKAQGMDTLALTDTNGLYGLVQFLEAAKDHGLRPIVGAEIRTGNERAVALVKDRQGYSNLCRILSDRHLKESFDIARSLLELSLGLVILTGSGDLLEKLAGNVEDLYAELVPGRQGHETLALSKKRGIPPVATNRVHFIAPEDHALHRLLRAIDLNTTLSRLPESELESPDSYLRTPRQMADYFFFCPEAVENTAVIAERCHFQLDFSPVFPQFENLNPEETFERLRAEAYKGARKRYGEITEKVQSRLEHELTLIKEKGFASIFLVVQDIVRQSPRTCGRGSAAASLVSYCLEITHVDPIRHNLYFERFLNPGRVDPPDIDVDFAWDERDDILDYVFKKYGMERTAMISNHVTFKKRAAIHEVAKVYGLPEAEITAVTGKLSGYYYDLVEEVERHPSLRYHEFSPPWPDILRLAERLEGIPRHLSVHCGGVVITPDATSNHVPVQRAVKEVNIIHWEKDQAEDAGLVKIDLLGNRSLAVIRDALGMIEENYGTRIDYTRWNPIDDPATQEMIARGDTMGVFYVESPATRLLQKKAGVGDFEHLVIHSSIIRPAANPYIHDYLERLKGKPYEPLHPLIGDLLEDTFGIMVYQEDVSKVAMRLAGFNSSEADELRKILSKKHKEKRLADLQKKFVKGALERGVDRESIRRIWEMILSFAGYSFCKPHSASYALVSFKSAWLRAHYPAEFMAAVISNQGGYYSTFAYISEARRLGLEVLMPDVNESHIRYRGKDRWIRVGLMQIKELTQKGMERVVTCRETGGCYLSFDDFLRRTEMDPADVRLLIKAGAFDNLKGRDRRAELMWRLEIQPKGRIHSLADKRASLFESDITEPPQVPPYDAKTLLQQELETFGFLVSRHPLELYRDRLKGLNLVTAKDMHQYVGKPVQMAGWLITGKVVSTKKKELMEFLTFEDETGLIETVFFPAVYDRYCHMLNKSRPYLLKGKVEEDFDAVTLTVEEVRYV